MPGTSIEQLRINGRKGGRPKYPKTLAVEKMREYIVSRVAAEVKPLLDAELDLSKGVYIGKLKKDTGEIVNVYQEKPDSRSIEYLFNQSIGRPKEFVEFSGSDEKPLQIQIIPALQKIYGQRSD